MIDLLLLPKELFSIPSVSLHEKRMLLAVEQLLSRLSSVQLHRDRWGNLIARYRFQPKGLQPLCFIGHLDHPGVVVEKGRLLLRGGVQEEWLKKATIRFCTQEGIYLPGKSQVQSIRKQESETELLVDRLPPEAAFGVWDLCEFQENATTITGRACDDLVAVVSMVSLLQYLDRNRIPADVECWFTRAEEVGFWGTFGRLNETKPNSDRIYISIEASQAKGFAAWGGGMVIRVGDRLSVFDSDVTRWLTDHASHLKKESPEFHFQRLLMGGGTCEATAIQEAGLRTGAICLPLKNYHNHGPSQRLAPEKVSRQDWHSLLQLILRISTVRPTVAQVKTNFQKILNERKKAAFKNLRAL